MGGVSTSFQDFGDSDSGPVDGVPNRAFDILVKSAISSNTPAANDYTETLTFRATSTY